MTGTDTQRDFLTQAFASAGALAQLGIPNLNPSQSTKATQVFEWLFGTADADMMRDSVRISLVGISQNSEPVPAEAEPRGGEQADVLVYCTSNRLADGDPRPDGSIRTFNKLNKHYLSDKFDCTHVFAWVIITGGDYPDEMQICPWFLDHGMLDHAQFQSQIEPGMLAKLIQALSLDKIVTRLLYTPIDGEQLFDKVMAHELAHTQRGNLLEDIGGSGGYGWKNCLKLSTARGGTEVPHRNADSVALFASISGLIESGGMVNKDGTFVRGDGSEGNSARRRSAPLLDAGGGLGVERRSEFNATSLKGRPLF